MIYLLLKSVHIIAVVVFVSGVLMQALILHVYRIMPLPQMPDERQLLSTLKNWDNMVTIPALSVTWLFGFITAIYGDWFTSLWMQIKLALVILLTVLHANQSGELLRIAEGKKGSSYRFSTGFLPFSVLLTFTVALAVFKPW